MRTCSERFTNTNVVADKPPICKNKGCYYWQNNNKHTLFSQKNKHKSNEVTWGFLNIISGWCSIQFTPAFSTPAIYSCFFHSCIFHPCNFARIAFSTSAFSVTPWKHCELREMSNTNEANKRPPNNANLTRWTPRYGSATGVHSLCQKLQCATVNEVEAGNQWGVACRALSQKFSDHREYVWIATTFATACGEHNEN